MGDSRNSLAHKVRIWLGERMGMVSRDAVKAKDDLIDRYEAERRRGKDYSFTELEEATVTRRNLYSLLSELAEEAFHAKDDEDVQRLSRLKERIKAPAREYLELDIKIRSMTKEARPEDLHISEGSEGGSTVPKITGEQKGPRLKWLSQEGLGVRDASLAVRVNDMVEDFNYMTTTMIDVPVSIDKHLYVQKGLIVPPGGVEALLLSRNVEGEKIENTSYEVFLNHVFSGIDLMVIGQRIIEEIGAGNYFPIDIDTKFAGMLFNPDNGKRSSFSLQSMMRLQQALSPYFENVRLQPHFDDWPPNALYDGEEVKLDWLKTIRELVPPNFDHPNNAVFYAVKKMDEMDHIVSDLPGELQVRAMLKQLTSKDNFGECVGEDLFRSMNDYTIEELGFRIFERLREDGITHCLELMEQQDIGVADEEMLRNSFDAAALWHLARGLHYSSVDMRNTLSYKNHARLLSVYECLTPELEEARQSVLEDIE